MPCDTAPFVAANYGQEWRKVVKIWDWKASPPNVEANGVWDSKLWPKVIQCDVCITKVNAEDAGLFAPVQPLNELT